MRFWLILTFGVGFWLAPRALAAEVIPITLFTRAGCVHCADARDFLSDYQTENPTIAVTEYKLEEPVGLARYNETRAKYNVPAVTPIILVRDQMLVGFNRPSDSGETIKRMVADSSFSPTGQAATCDEVGESCAAPAPRTWLVTLPLLGTVNLATMSLPLVTVLVGLADGFNPCAMWALLALLGFLLNQPRRRLWLVGGAFITASFTFSVVVLWGWLTTFSLLDLLATPGWQTATTFIKGGLAVLALGIAVSLVRQANSPAVCKVIRPGQKHRLVDRLAAVAQHSNLLLAISGAVVLAVLVNLIELICSIGLPVLYTNHLASQSLSGTSNLGYILLYTVFYMLDDLVVFFSAALLARVVLLSHRFAQPVKLTVAVLIVALVAGYLFALQ